MIQQHFWVYTDGQFSLIFLLLFFALITVSVELANRMGDKGKR